MRTIIRPGHADRTPPSALACGMVACFPDKRKALLWTWLGQPRGRRRGDVDEEGLRRHFELLGVDNEAAAESYSDDAVLEYMPSGERIRGRAAITASRQAYPGRPTHFRVDRWFGTGDHAAVELTMFIDGDVPHPVAATLDLRDGLISRERLYICEPWEAPQYRARWAEPLCEE